MLCPCSSQVVRSRSAGTASRAPHCRVFDRRLARTEYLVARRHDGSKRHANGIARNARDRAADGSETGGRQPKRFREVSRAGHLAQSDDPTLPEPYGPSPDGDVRTPHDSSRVPCRHRTSARAAGRSSETLSACARTDGVPCRWPFGFVQAYASLFGGSLSADRPGSGARRSRASWPPTQPAAPAQTALFPQGPLTLFYRSFGLLQSSI